MVGFVNGFREVLEWFYHAFNQRPSLAVWGLAGLLPKASTSSLGFCLLMRGFRGLGFGASVISGFRKRELDVCSVPSTLYS